MPTHRLGPPDTLEFAHQAPQRGTGLTFVFFNLTGDAASWEALIAPAPRAQGHGTLLWHFRGQPDSRFGDPGSIGAAQIVADAVALLSAERLAPRSPSACRPAGCSRRRRTWRARRASGSC